MACQETLFLVSTWLLPANKEKIMAVFSSGMTNLKSKNIKAGKYEDLDKAVFKWFMSAKSNNIPEWISHPQEKATIVQKRLV